jgi:multidrug transporter EmrE-like cation transporter
MKLKSHCAQNQNVHVNKNIYQAINLFSEVITTVLLLYKSISGIRYKMQQTALIIFYGCSYYLLAQLLENGFEHTHTGT